MPQYFTYKMSTISTVFTLGHTMHAHELIKCCLGASQSMTKFTELCIATEQDTFGCT